MISRVLIAFGTFNIDEALHLNMTAFIFKWIHLKKYYRVNTVREISMNATQAPTLQDYQ